MRATRWVLGFLGLVVIGGLVWYFQFRKQGGTAAAAPSASAASSANRPVPVTISKAERQDVPIYLEGLGTVTPLYTVNVRTIVDGRLDKVTFKEGQFVKKGDQLAQIDPRPFAIQLHAAEAAIARDTATLKNAKLDLERYKTLRAGNLIPQQQLDTQQALVDTTLATIMADQTQAESARLNLDYARIVSPIDGVTGVRQVDPGNIVHAADTGGIVLLTQLDPIAVIFSLPEDDYVRVAKYLAGAELTVEVRSRDGGQILGKGKLALIDNQINQTTATIRLKAVLDNPDKILWPGEFVKARVFLTVRKDVVTVAAPAVQLGVSNTTDTSKEPPKFVYVVKDDMTVEKWPITLEEPPRDNIAIIASGLTGGERVVSEGYNQIKPGSKVMDRATAMTAGSAGAPEPGASGKKRHHAPEGETPPPSPQPSGEGVRPSP